MAAASNSAFLPAVGGKKFETVLAVRPDDIDMNQHVHGSRYFDYVLAARYEQMARCYGLAMEEFTKAGFAWFTRTAFIEYKRPLRLGDAFIVRTWVQEMFKDSVRVDFEILRADNGKRACDGHCHYTLVSAATGRAQAIPEWIRAKYAV